MDPSTEPQSQQATDAPYVNGTEIPDPTMLVQPISDPSVMPTIPMQSMSISADEIALYDRQIRLWGVKAQEMIRSASILLIGIKALGSEVAKNLVLAGIGSLTILDPENVVEEDLGSQFLITEDDIGKNRAAAAAVELRKMNPRVNIVVDQDPVMTKIPQYFAAYNIVLTTGQTFDTASTINMSCRMWNAKFYAADLHGLYGYIFSDLIVHQYVIERAIQSNIATKQGTTETSTRMVLAVSTKKENNKTQEIVTKQEMYCPILLANSSPLPKEVTRTRRTKLRVPAIISCLRAVFEFQKQSGGRLPQNSQHDVMLFTKIAGEKHQELQLPMETLNSATLRSFLQNVGTEIPPTAAYLGGQLAQDVINVLGQREQPLQNFLVFDGDDFQSPIYSLQPIFDPSLAGPIDELPGAVPLSTSAKENGNGVVTNGIESSASGANGQASVQG